MSELLNPQTFEVTLPSHLGMPEDQRPVFVFKSRSWRETIELDEITAKFYECESDGQIAQLLVPVIREHLVADKSPDIERLNCSEVCELFAGLRECESPELAAKKKSLLQSLFGMPTSAEEDAKPVPNPNPGPSTVPAAEERGAPAAASEDPLT